MNNDFLTIYAALYEIMIALAIYLVCKLSSDVTTHYAFVFFRYLINSYIIYTITSVLVTFGEFGAFTYPDAVFKALVYISNFCCTVCYSQIYMLSTVRFHPEYFKKRPFQIISLIPTFAVWGTMLISVFNGCMLRVLPGNHYEYGPFSVMLPLIGLFYFIVIIVFAARSFIKEPGYVTRRRLIATILSVIFVMFWAFMDSKFEKMTILPAAFLAAIVFLFVNIQEANIYTDYLTKMDNRTKAIEYLEGAVKHLSGEHPLYLFMCDVDYFKKINDRYGHGEGDEALIIIAGVLKNASAKFGAFASRYGGDEFLLSCAQKNAEDAHEYSPDEIADYINSELAQACSGKPYPLQMSIGCVRCEDPAIPFMNYIKQADQELYRKKVVVHSKDMN